MKSIGINFKWIKELPVNKINEFEDRVVYNAALFTREYTKRTDAYPYLTGNLSRSEMAKPIRGHNKVYCLLSGTGYDKYVWKMKNVHWTNRNTKSQWYYKQFHQTNSKIMKQAISTALKEI